MASGGARQERALALFQSSTPCRCADVGLFLQKSLEIAFGYTPTGTAALAP